MSDIRGWAVRSPKQKLEPYSFNPGELGEEDVEVEHCGICHADFA